MGLLACVMFDSIRALNPILLIGSILSTFFQYCGLVLLIIGIVLAFRALTGMADAGEFYVYILVDGWVIYSEKMQGLAAGESKTFTCEWTFINSGCFIISAVVDPNKEEIV